MKRREIAYLRPPAPLRGHLPQTLLVFLPRVALGTTKRRALRPANLTLPNMLRQKIISSGLKFRPNTTHFPAGSPQSSKARMSHLCVRLVRLQADMRRLSRSLPMAQSWAYHPPF